MTHCADALIGSSGPSPVEPLGVSAVLLGDGAREEEGFFEVPFDGFGSGVFLHALVAHATVCEEDGDLAALVSRLFGGGGGVAVFVIGGGGGLGHFWSFGVRLLDFHVQFLMELQLSIAGVPLHRLYALVKP